MARVLLVAALAVAASSAPAWARLVDDAASEPVAAFPRGAILFGSSRPQAVDAGFGVYAVDAEGTLLKELALDSGERARWSPDGRWIAYGRRRGDAYDLYVARADGRQVRRVFRDDRCGDPGGVCGGLYVVNTDGTRPRSTM
jgi:hypothetical protein